MQQISMDYDQNVRTFDQLMGVGRSFDIVVRDLIIARRRARIYVIDGYGEGEVIERILSFWLSLRSITDARDMEDFINRYVTFGEVHAEWEVDTAVRGALTGRMLLLVEGYNACALIDAKSFPARGVEEPSSGKVLRGSHDGFVETTIWNAALLRRRICDPRLTLEGHKISERSQTDVILCYLEDKVDQKLLAKMREKLSSISLQSIALSQESVAEAMMKRQWYNPFPKVRYTERPDTAAACILEGDIVLIVDNSPAAMILPTRFFDFVQEANDFYFPPLIGMYLRLLRMTVFFLTLFITPVWYLLVKNPEYTTGMWDFLEIASECKVPILVQLLLVEFIVDILKLASLNTPSAFSNSFSMIGALVLGDFAVQSNWLVPEVLAYMAFVAVTNFAQPSYELGYAFKLLRLVLLLLVGAFDLPGLLGGCLLILVLLLTTKPIDGGRYLYPLVPFNAKKLRKLLLRRPVSSDNT